MAQSILQRLQKLDIDAVREHLQYAPDLPSGIMWIKRSARATVVGAMAGRQESNGYWRVKFRGQRVACHHIVLLMHDQWPLPGGNQQVDHIDRNTSNNRIENLRWVTHSQNGRNKRGYGYSPYKYVTYHIRHKKWYAVWGTQDIGKTRYCGCFADPYEAHCAAVADRNAFTGEAETPEPRIDHVALYPTRLP